MGGLEATRKITQGSEDTKVIALTGVANDLFAKQLMQAGASAYVTKGAGFDEIVTAIKTVLEDGSFERVAYQPLFDALVANGSLERTRRLAREHARRATEAIEAFPEGAYRSVMLELPELVISRDR